MSQPRRNILVAVVGMTPQVVTETLYALEVEQRIKVSETYVITTEEGKKNILGDKGLHSLADEIARLSQIYECQLPTFSVEKNCITVEDESFQIADIDSAEKSLAFFNAMTEFVRNLSADSNSAIHCSIAGGRKTMGLAAGYAMSLFGRPQDTLSHVLASKELEDSKKFFPEPGHDAEKVVLVEIPFIRLRDFIDIELSKGSYSDFVSLAQARVDIRTGDFGARFGIIGHSPKMIDVFSRIEDYSESDYPILIIGETGTGKELVARAIHQNSNRAESEFVAVNCGSVSHDLLESELFGHVKGAFTGAGQDRAGFFETADNGTIFLDEVTETDSNFQKNLLRVLQEGEYRRVGETLLRKTNARVIAATNRVDLRREITGGDFRQDLYYRLDVLRISIPPLRERKEDIPELVDYFLMKHSKKVGKSFDGLSPVFQDALQSYDYPGNVRELENNIIQTVVGTGGKTITDKYLGQEIKDAWSRILATIVIEEPPETILPFEDMKKHWLIHVLRITRGNRSKAAQLMQLDYDTVLNWIKKYGIEEHHYRNTR